VTIDGLNSDRKVLQAECVSEYLADLWLSVDNTDLDDVETTADIPQVALIEIGLRGPDEPLPLRGGHGLSRSAVGVGRPAPDLHKNERTALLGDKIDLAILAAIVRTNDAIAAPAQLRRGGDLRSLT